ARCGRALTQRGMTGAGCGCLRAECPCRVARIRQRSLRVAQTLLRGALLDLEANTRGVGLAAPGLECGALLFSRAAFEGDDFVLAGQTRVLLVGSVALRFVGDDRFFLRMLLGLQAGDRASGFGHRQLELGDVGSQTRELL